MVCLKNNIQSLDKPKCYTEIISKLLSLPSRPSSGLHVRRALGMVQLNMSSIHWHVLSHVESWNFRPFELTRFSRQFVPERASCSLSGRIKYKAVRGIHVSVLKGAQILPKRSWLYVWPLPTWSSCLSRNLQVHNKHTEGNHKLQASFISHNV